MNCRISGSSPWWSWQESQRGPVAAICAGATAALEANWSAARGFFGGGRFVPSGWLNHHVLVVLIGSSVFAMLRTKGIVHTRLRFSAFLEQDPCPSNLHLKFSAIAMEGFSAQAFKLKGRFPRDEELGSNCAVSVRGLFLMQTIACKGDASHDIIIGDVIGRGGFSTVARLSCLEQKPPIFRVFGACEFNLNLDWVHPLLLKIREDLCHYQHGM